MTKPITTVEELEVLPLGTKVYATNGTEYLVDDWGNHGLTPGGRVLIGPGSKHGTEVFLTSVGAVTTTAPPADPRTMSRPEMYRLLDNVAVEIGEREYAAGPGTEEACRMADADNVRQDFHDLLASTDAYEESGESMTYGHRRPPKENLPRLRRMLATYGIQTAGTEVSNPVARA